MSGDPTSDRVERSAEELRHRAAALLDRDVRERLPGGVAVRERDAARTGASRLPRTTGIVLGVEHGIARVPIAVSPAVAGDRGGVAGGVEAAGRQHRRELVADALLEVRQRQVVEELAAA